MTATFSGSSTTSVQVATLPNEVAERVRKLAAVINITANATRDGRVTHGSPDTATVQIDDDDSKLIVLISIHILAMQSHRNYFTPPLAVTFQCMIMFSLQHSMSSLILLHSI